MTETKKDIEVIPGETNKNILLIAPHGVMDDDDNAGKLARAIQKWLGCNAIINEVFRKPIKDEKTGEYGKPDFNDKRLADLNYIPHAKAHPTFTKEITKKITDPKNTYVFWIHGIKDENLAQEAQEMNYGNAKCLVGYGQGTGNGTSMDADKSKQFVGLLTENGISSVETHENSKKYRGASKNNMNQYFKIIGGKFASVKSVQLEFAKEGVRVGWDIGKTGIKVAKAIAGLVGCKTVDIPEEVADKKVVNEAIEELMKHIDENHKNNVAVGHCLIKHFYGGDYDKAKKGLKVKGASLNAMLEELQKRGNAPSKSWFYNAVNLAVDDRAFKNDIDYLQLNLSQKIYLTYLNKDEQWHTAKLGLIKELPEGNISIKDLLERIAKIKGISGSDWPSKEQIAVMDTVKKNKYKERAEKRKNSLVKAIEDLNAELDKCNEIISAVDGPVKSADEQQPRTGTDG